MLQPKRTKYRRPQKGRCKGNAMRGNQLAFGSFGIKSLETHWITARQIEAARVAMTRYMQREGQVFAAGFDSRDISVLIIQQVDQPRDVHEMLDLRRVGGVNFLKLFPCGLSDCRMRASFRRLL